MKLIEKAPLGTVALRNPTFFALGDWSDDGHGHCAYALIDSNVNVDALRELHFQRPFLGELFSDYRQNSIDIGSIIGSGFEAEICALLRSRLEGVQLCGITSPLSDSEMNDLLAAGATDAKLIEILEESDLELSLSLEALMQFWLMGLKGIQPDVEFVWVVPKKSPDGLFHPKKKSNLSKRLGIQIPDIYFYGFDKNGRHLQVPGYGLFDTDDSRFDNHCW